MKIIKCTKNNTAEVIKTTAAVIKAGGLVVFPSDTVYGLLADARNPNAVNKLFEFKKRSTGKAISIFVANKSMADNYVLLNKNSYNVIDNLLPGPFTVVCHSKHQTDPRLEAENGTLAIRIPSFPLINQLLVSAKGRSAFGGNFLDFPVTATSANLFGTSPHYSIDSFVKNTPKSRLNLVDLVVDFGKLPHNLPSTVIDTTTAEITTIRQGDLIPDSVKSIISKSEKQTFNIGRFIGNKYCKDYNGKSIVFLLSGELGVGKTIFVKGLASSLKITEIITSPTYNIINEYPIVVHNFMYSAGIPRTLVHLDLYRLNTPEEVAEIGIFDYLSAEYVVAIEWPERLGTTILKRLAQNSQIINIIIQHIDTNSRKIQIYNSNNI